MKIDTDGESTFNIQSLDLSLLFLYDKKIRRNIFYKGGKNHFKRSKKKNDYQNEIFSFRYYIFMVFCREEEKLFFRESKTCADDERE